ncbi:MAG: hypothetical protein ACFE0Q_11950 [Anaerolineae bacterium]
MSTSYKFGRDVDQAVTMAEVLEDYVRGDQLYGYASGLFSTMPSMTAGALVLRLRRLDLLRGHLKDYQSKKLDKAIDRFMQVRTDWTYHYSGKLKEEAHSRIDAMKPFFYECSDNIRNCIGIYKPEMMRRTIVQELVYEMTALNITDSALTDKIAEVDEKLRKITEEAGFQWAEVLQPAYDRDAFWWLYYSPPDLH